mmetsp:Transcript_15497/g.30022  ORF Transcript_15497/g.30022 Transcript_15497/m.30022 type:complete len:380 (+) Transcript_15497:181-1320(+)
MTTGMHWFARKRRSLARSISSLGSRRSLRFDDEDDEFDSGETTQETRTSSTTHEDEEGEDDSDRPTVALARKHGRSRASSKSSKHHNMYQMIWQNRFRGSPQQATSADAMFAHVLERGVLADATYMFSQRKLAPRIYKEGRLEKQGQTFKTWHTRYFVLTTRGLAYYVSKRKFRDFEQPLGVIPFRDVQYEGGRVVNDVPDGMARVLHVGRQHKNLFCMYLETRTFIMSASSPEDKHSWVTAISQAYDQHLSKTFNAREKVDREDLIRKRRSVAVGTFLEQGMYDVEDPNAGILNAGTTWADDLFEECNEDSEMDDILDVQLKKLQEEILLRRTFTAWFYLRLYQQNAKTLKDDASLVREPTVDEFDLSSITEEQSEML